MRHITYILILYLSTQVKVQAQELSREFGVIGKPEAEFVSYSPDKSAEAVVLFDEGKSYFIDSERSFDVIFERAARIKIISDPGLKWAEVEIPFYHEGSIYEEVYEIEAYTYNPEGGTFRKTAFNPTGCHDEKLNEFWSVKKFALPDVKAGSIIEYRYKINSQYVFNLRDWEFQSRIPTIYSEYEVRMIPFYEYVYVLQGAKKFDNSTSEKSNGLSRIFGPIEYKEMVHKFVMKDVPAFNDEEYISSINDYIIKLDFQLNKVISTDGTTRDILSTWPDLVKNLIKDEDVTRFAKKCEKLTAKLFSPDSLLNKSQREKFNFILDYVKANFSWNNQNGKYSSKSPNDLVRDKFGNAADLNLMVVGLLNSAGIEAFPILLSTRDHGRIKVDYPYIQAFNYVIAGATIDGKRILTDATEIHCQNDRIPTRCLNDKGLLIKEGPVEWVNLQATVPSVLDIDIAIDSIGTNTYTNTRISATEYYAVSYRSNYGEDKKKILARTEDEKFKIDESTILINNMHMKDLPYKMNFNTSYNPETINSKIYIAPFLDEPITENPFKQTNRSYPIDMIYPVSRTFNSSISIPGGYKVDFVPEEVKILNDMFELNYKVEMADRKLNIIFKYAFKKPLYQASEYSNLKYYFKEIINKANEKVVLAPVN